MIDPRTHAKALYESGDYTMRDIAAAVGREMSVIREWKREDGWQLRAEPKAFGPEERERAFTLLDEGHNPYQVAKLMGVHHKTIQRWLDGRTIYAWRCYCVGEQATLVKAVRCPLCDKRAPFL
jgi:transposase